LVKDTKKNMKNDLENQIEEYLRQKKVYGDAERFIRNLRASAFQGKVYITSEYVWTCRCDTTKATVLRGF
jgi:virulence-associated protein VapD